MTALGKAATGRPFSNGTEGDAWMGKWCAYCVHDHTSHDLTFTDGGCEIVLWMMTAEQYDSYPECLIPEPDDGSFSLPSRMVCTRFSPCTEGRCDGDPGADDRAERGAQVMAYWRERSVA
jgi:hypothetical protein